MKTKLVDLFYRKFWAILDWIYPPICASCGEPGYRVCASCRSKISYIDGNLCFICGEPLQNQNRVCENCAKNTPPYTAMRNLANYEGVIRDCIHALKYEQNQALGEYFAGELANLVEHSRWHVDLVLPVPLSPKREAQRGYNQANCLARPLAARLGVRYHLFALKRTRDTPTQVGLSGEERWQNVVGAFYAVPEIVIDKKLLIVDDVMTTGATMAACAQALQEAGSAEIYCLTLGRFASRADFPIRTRHQV